MTQLLTGAQMRAIETAAVASGLLTEEQLMVRAGRQVVDAVFERWADLRAIAGRALVLCGPGNNGGDGYVVARLLVEWGWQVVVAEMSAGRLPKPAAAQAMALPASVARIGLEAVTEADVATSDLIIDALFGTGLTRPVGKKVARVLTLAMTRPQAKLVSVDILSGYSADSGRLLAEADSGFPAALTPDLTVTFEAPRLGHFIGDWAALEGPLAVRAIGLEAMLHQIGPGLEGVVTLTDQAIAKGLGKAGRLGSHKYSFGHALIVGGAPVQAGAARLAARAALRIGAGLVTLALPETALASAAGPPDAIMRSPASDAADLTDKLKDPRISAICIGPGLGLHQGHAAMLRAVIADGRPTVLDADALTLLSRDPDLGSNLHAACLITPHGGEFARLFPELAAGLVQGALSKVEAARSAARSSGCTVLFKGADTVIADPAGRVAVNSAQGDRAAPWLATAGAGDVLAGMAAGLLARGLAPFEAAQCAAWLHVEAARTFGPGLVADDLPEALPTVFRSLGL